MHPHMSRQLAQYRAEDLRRTADRERLAAADRPEQDPPRRRRSRTRWLVWPLLTRARRT